MPNNLQVSRFSAFHPQTFFYQSLRTPASEEPIIFPYYEEKNIGVLLDELGDILGSNYEYEIIVVDDTKELLKKMGHKKLTVELQEKVNEIPSSLHKYNLSMGTNKMSLNYTYNVQAKQTGITNLLQDLKDAGLKLKDLKTEQSTLEKIFVNLVRDKNEN